MKTFNKWTIYSIELSILILLCLLFASYYNIKRADLREQWVKHSGEILIHTGKVQLLASEAGVQSRYYMLTGNKSAVERFENASKAMRKELDILKILTADNILIQPALDSVKTYILKRFDFSNQVIALRKSGDMQGSIKLVQGGIGNAFTNKTDFYIHQIENGENKLMAQRKIDSKKAQIAMSISLWITVGFILAMMVLIVLKFRKESIERNGLVEDLTIAFAEKKVALLEREKMIADLLQRNKTLGESTYFVSHNLRAPVANIIGLGAVLKMTDLDEHDEIMEKILFSVNELDQMIKDLNTALQVRG